MSCEVDVVSWVVDVVFCPIGVVGTGTNVVNVVDCDTVLVVGLRVDNVVVVARSAVVVTDTVVVGVGTVVVGVATGVILSHQERGL